MELLDKKTFTEWAERIMNVLTQLNAPSSKIPNRPTIDGEPLIDNQEVCMMLQISKRTLQRYRATRELPFHIIYHKTWYRESEILEFMKKHFERNSNNTLKRKRRSRKDKSVL